MNPRIIRLAPRIGMAVGAMLLGLSLSMPNVALAEGGHLGKALDYIEGGDLRSAVIVLKSALQKDTNDAEARFLLGKTYLQMGLGGGAEKELRWARRLGMDEDLVLIPMGRALLLQGEFDRLRDEIPVRESLSKENKALVLTLHGLASLSEGRKSEADELLDKAIKLDPNQAETMVARARVAIARKQHIKADTILEDALGKDAKCAECWVLKAELKRLDRKYDIANEYFQNAIDLEPGNYSAYLGQAATLIEMGELEQAGVSLDHVEQVYPQHPLRDYLNAVVAFQDRDLEKAGNLAAKALKEMPDHLPSTMLSGSIAFASGSYVQAEEFIGAYLKAVPGHIPARKLMAASYLRTDEADKAIEMLRPVVQAQPKDAQALALFGSAYFQSGDYDNGSRYLKKALELAPDANAVRTQLALSEMAKGDTEGAIDQLNNVTDGLEKQKQENEGQDTASNAYIQADVLLVLAHLKEKAFDKAVEAASILEEKMPDNGLPANLRGVAMLGKKDLEGARREFETALRIDPKFHTARLNLARLDLREEQIDSARQQMDTLLEMDPSNAPGMMLMAEIENQSKNNDAALQWIEKAWDMNPGARQPGLALMREHLRKGEADEALGVARAMYDADPSAPEMVRALASAQLAAGQPASAVTTLRRMMKNDEGDISSRYMLGTALAGTKRYDEAAKLIRGILTEDPKHLPSNLALARIQLAQEDMDAAQRTARNIQRRFPDRVEGHRLEADIHMAKKEESLALKSYKKAYDITPSAALAIAMYRAKSAAAQDNPTMPLEQWLEGHPKDAGVRLMLAMDQRSQGKVRQAIDQYEQVIEVEPQNVLALNNLANLYQDRKDKRALEVSEQAFELAPKQAAIADTYGWILVQSGQAGAAIAVLEQAMEEAPNVPTVRYHLAVALADAGETGKARRELEKLMVRGGDFTEKKDARALLDKLSR